MYIIDLEIANKYLSIYLSMGGCIWVDVYGWSFGRSQMGNFVHTAFKAYCGVLLGPV